MIDLTMSRYTGTDGPLRPDDDPKRRTKRRVNSDLSCDNVSNSGETWRDGVEVNLAVASAKKRDNALELSRFGERCPVKSDTDVQAPEWRNWQTRRIQNPAHLYSKPLINQPLV